MCHLCDCVRLDGRVSRIVMVRESLQDLEGPVSLCVVCGCVCAYVSLWLSFVDASPKLSFSLS